MPDALTCPGDGNDKPIYPLQKLYGGAIFSFFQCLSKIISKFPSNMLRNSAFNHFPLFQGIQRWDVMLFKITLKISHQSPFSSLNIKFQYCNFSYHGFFLRKWNGKMERKWVVRSTYWSKARQSGNKVLLAPQTERKFKKQNIQWGQWWYNRTSPTMRLWRLNESVYAKSLGQCLGIASS